MKTIGQGSNTNNGDMKSEEIPQFKPQPFQHHLYRPSLSINNHHLLTADHWQFHQDIDELQSKASGTICGSVPGLQLTDQLKSEPHTDEKGSSQCFWSMCYEIG